MYLLKVGFLLCFDNFFDFGSNNKKARAQIFRSFDCFSNYFKVFLTTVKTGLLASSKEKFLFLKK